MPLDSNSFDLGRDTEFPLHDLEVHEGFSSSDTIDSTNFIPQEPTKEFCVWQGCPREHVVSTGCDGYPAGVLKIRHLSGDIVNFIWINLNPDELLSCIPASVGLAVRQR